MAYPTADFLRAAAVENLDGGKALVVFTRSSPMPTAVNRSGTANTTSASLAAANANRTGMEIQNVGANNIGVNEFGAAAAIGSPGTYTLVPGATMKVRTTNQINAIAATGATPYTATEY